MRIEGMIKVTHSGKYLFKLESDGNSYFYFMDKRIISKDSNDIQWEGDGSSTFRMSAQSPTQFMNTEYFYKIKIEYSHSVSRQWNDPNKSFLRLVWAQEVIKRDTRPGSLPGKGYPGGGRNYPGGRGGSGPYNRFGPGNTIKPGPGGYGGNGGSVT